MRKPVAKRAKKPAKQPAKRKAITAVALLPSRDEQLLGAIAELRATVRELRQYLRNQEAIRTTWSEQIVRQFIKELETRLQKP